MGKISVFDKAEVFTTVASSPQVLTQHQRQFLVGLAVWRSAVAHVCFAWPVVSVRAISHFLICSCVRRFLSSFSDDTRRSGGWVRVASRRVVCSGALRTLERRITIFFSSCCKRKMNCEVYEKDGNK